MKKFYFKILIWLLLLMVLIEGLFIPQKTEAVIPVVDSANLTAKWVDIFEKIARWIKEDLMASLRDVVAKRLIDYIVDQTIVWIQGGGKPKFVTDWNGFLKDASNIAFDQVIRDVGLAWLCSPFKLQVKISLLPVQRFQQRIECTLDKVVSNIEDFYNDFKKGGWIAYNEMWLPQNNYYGEILLIHDEMLARADARKEAAQNEALAGKGFLSVKKCQGGQTQEQFCNSACMTGQGSVSDFQQCFQDCMNVSMTEAELCDVSGGKMTTQTPGDIVGAAAAEAITSDSKWAANIRSWVSALINAAINRLTQEGLALMQPSKASGYDSYYPPEYKKFNNYSKQEQIDKINKFINEWQYLYNAKNQSLSYAEQIKATFLEINNHNCQPPVSDSKIQTIQADIDKLTNKTADLKSKIDEGNNLIKQITNASTQEEEMAANQAFLDFINKYNTPELQEQITIGSGSAREAADQELATKKTEFSNAFNRLNNCLVSQNNEYYISYIISQYNNLLGKTQSVLDIKQQSLVAVQETIVVFQKLKSNNCYPSVLDSDITDLQDKEQSLKNKITALQILINDINSNLSEAQNIYNAGNYEDSDVIHLKQSYLDLYNNHQSNIVSIASGNAERLAAEELQNKQTELSDAQNRLNNCLAGQQTQ